MPALLFIPATIYPSNNLSQQQFIPATIYPSNKGTPSMARYAYILIAVICFALIAPAMWFDLAVARAVLNAELPGDVDKGFNQAEVFAHGVGIFFIGLTVVVVDPKSRRQVVRLWLVTILAGLIVNGIKVQIVRDRPQATDLTKVVSVSETFHGYHFGNWDDQHQAFVSGHTAAAFALAVALTQIYPHARWLFFTFAILAALQRITSHAHYPSDVLGGAGVGLLVAAALYLPSPISRMFDQFEGDENREGNRE
jgi:membrane-associated phospholipid phosphatase